MPDSLLLALAAVQGVATFILLARLAPGRHRVPPIEPRTDAPVGTSVTVVVPTLNEARRIGPLLEKLPLQSPLVREILIVDSGSRDGTRELVQRAADIDGRIRLLSDPPLPAGWVGKAWAMEFARGEATSEWILNLDADTVPHANLANAVIGAATERELDAVSFSPRFAGQTAAERFLQPALLTTLVYRTGAPGDTGDPNRLLANGQCFLVRRDVLHHHGGYEPVRSSFAEDVSLVRHLARSGARVAFLDGSKLYDVRSYGSAAEMWREWGRSVDLTDATCRWRHIADIAFLICVQALPPIVLAAGALSLLPTGAIARTLLWLNGTLLGIRIAMSAALAPSYERRGPSYWLSVFADPAAVLRVVMSTVVRPKAWRSRRYQ